MPRPNPQRTLVDEENLARRIAFEREQRGWSYEGLAERMTRAGCPVQASALFKIEKGSPRRRITVAEHVALSKVFGVHLEDLLAPPELAANAQARRLFREYRAAMVKLAAARQHAQDVWGRVTAQFKDEHLREHFAELADAELAADEKAAAFLTMRDAFTNQQRAQGVVPNFDADAGSDESEGGTRGKPQEKS